MAIIGKSSLSVSKKDLLNQTSNGVAAKSMVFAHKCNAGDTGFNLSSLSVPNEMTLQGFTNPSASELAQTNILFYRKNLKLWSSVRGDLKDFFSYTVASTSQINFLNFYQIGTSTAGAEQDEIIVGELQAVPLTGQLVVDASPIVVSGTLTAGQTDINVGTPFETAKFISQQVGAVMLLIEGSLQMRNVANSSVGDGNYYEVPASSGYGSVLRMNTAAEYDRPYVVISTIGYAERPTGSMMAIIDSVNTTIQNLSGNVIALSNSMAESTGLPLSTFTGAPSYSDLATFNNRVTALETPTPEFDNGPSGSVDYIDLNKGFAQTVFMTANCTFFITGGVVGNNYTLRLVQDATGGRTYTWPANVKWAGGSPPVASGANKMDLVSFYYTGAYYLGNFSSNY